MKGSLLLLCLLMYLRQYMKSLPLLEGVPKKSIDESQSKIEILFPTYTSDTAELCVGNGNSG